MSELKKKIMKRQGITGSGHQGWARPAKLPGSEGDAHTSRHACYGIRSDVPCPSPAPHGEAPAPATYPTGPDVVGVSHGLPLVEFVNLLQLLPVHVRLRLLVGKTADGLHGGDGLLGGVVGLGQGVLHILGELLRGAEGGRGGSAGARLPVAHHPARPSSAGLGKRGHGDIFQGRGQQG